jgi:drug/metabolite transporter (DMT)-like permease
MVILFALLAALSNAVNEATQHVASTAAPSRSSGWQLVVYLFRNPLWLLGWAALIAAFVFQALALSQGQISVVQPLLATELVFMLLLRRVWIHQSIRPITWAAATLTCVGLTVFIAAGQPGGGQPIPTSRHWFTAGLACCAAAAVLAVLARWGSPSLRAALYGSASAVMWALVATFIKAEHFAADGAALAIAAIGFAVMCAGVVLRRHVPARRRTEIRAVRRSGPSTVGSAQVRSRTAGVEMTDAQPHRPVHQVAVRVIARHPPTAPRCFHHCGRNKQPSPGRWPGLPVT